MERIYHKPPVNSFIMLLGDLRTTEQVVALHIYPGLINLGR